jgi:hypothetical protein
MRPAHPFHTNIDNDINYNKHHNSCAYYDKHYDKHNDFNYDKYYYRYYAHYAADAESKAG